MVLVRHTRERESISLSRRQRVCMNVFFLWKGRAWKTFFLCRIEDRHQHQIENTRLLFIYASFCLFLCFFSSCLSKHILKIGIKKVADWLIDWLMVSRKKEGWKGLGESATDLLTLCSRRWRPMLEAEKMFADSPQRQTETAALQAAGLPFVLFADPWFSQPCFVCEQSSSLQSLLSFIRSLIFFSFFLFSFFFIFLSFPGFLHDTNYLRLRVFPISSGNKTETDWARTAFVSNPCERKPA